MEGELVLISFGEKGFTGWLLEVLSLFFFSHSIILNSSWLPNCVIIKTFCEASSSRHCHVLVWFWSRNGGCEFRIIDKQLWSWGHPYQRQWNARLWAPSGHQAIESAVLSAFCPVRITWDALKGVDAGRASEVLIQANQSGCPSTDLFLEAFMWFHCISRAENQLSSTVFSF